MQEGAGNGLIIVAIDIENFRCLKAAKFRPSESGVQIIAGQNGAGKSAVTEGFRAILTGLTNSISMPIREGEHEALYSFQLKRPDGSIINVKCVWTDATTKAGNKKKPVLEVTNADGSVFPDGPTMLRNLLGDIKFNLAEFIDGTTPEHARFRRDAIMKTVPGLDEELTALTKKREGFFGQRTEIGRDVTRIQGKLESMEDPEEDLPEEEQSVLELTKHLQSVDVEIRKKRDLRVDISSIKSTIDSLESDIAELEAKLEDRRKILTLRKSDLLTTNNLFESMPEDSELQSKRENAENVIATAEETNRKIRYAQAYRADEIELLEVKADQAKLTTEIEAVDQEKADLLETAKFPISDLSVDDHDITYKDKPWVVAATSDRLKVALATGFVQQPELEALFVPDGNRFDPNSMKLIDELAKDRNFQVYLEYVVAGREDAEKLGAFYIEDGTVAE